uniref:fructose-bisphosphatase class III n=1 Tax=uncultured Olegusella sp. TaxID=1979846 RepID=UPI0026096362
MDKTAECISTSKQKYLKLLGEKFPTTQSVYTEIINLEAILNLPAATEHFMSDVHGEYEAFVHILNNCSGAIREQVTKLFSAELNKRELADFCTLIYYSQEKLRRLHVAGDITSEWYLSTLKRLIVLARTLASNYTQSKVRKAVPVEYAYIIDELLHAGIEDKQRRQDYHARIFQSIVDTGAADDFIVSLSSLIKRLAVDHLHLVGDIFDRGPHADRILDHLMNYQSLDVQWGNHDIVWMGAAAGSSLCQIAVIRTNIHYNSLDMLESAYGISLRELENFARRNYTTYDNLTPLYKAISVILFKLEGQAIARHPNWKTTAKRRLLDKIDVTHAVVTIDGHKYPLRTRDFPTVDFAGDPYALSKEEQNIVDKLANAFSQSDRLRRHVSFLYEKG